MKKEEYVVVLLFNNSIFNMMQKKAVKVKLMAFLFVIQINI